MFSFHHKLPPDSARQPSTHRAHNATTSSEPGARGPEIHCVSSPSPKAARRTSVYGTKYGGNVAVLARRDFMTCGPLGAIVYMLPRPWRGPLTRLHDLAHWPGRPGTSQASRQAFGGRGRREGGRLVLVICILGSGDGRARYRLTKMQRQTTCSSDRWPVRESRRAAHDGRVWMVGQDSLWTWRLAGQAGSSLAAAPPRRPGAGLPLFLHFSRPQGLRPRSSSPALPDAMTVKSNTTRHGQRRDDTAVGKRPASGLARPARPPRGRPGHPGLANGAVVILECQRRAPGGTRRDRALAGSSRPPPPLLSFPLK